MKKLIGLLAVMASAYSINASAQVPLPFTRCEIDIGTQNFFPVILEIGVTKGIATCWDLSYNAYPIPVRSTLPTFGGGAQIGFCQTTQHISAIGVGFALSNLLGF